MDERAVIDRMIADGASHEQIMQFVQAAKARRAKPTTPAATPILNPRTGMPLETYPDDVQASDLETARPDQPNISNLASARAAVPGVLRDMGRTAYHRMSPAEERTMNAGMAGLLATTATAGLLGAGAGTGLASRLAVAALSNAAGGEVSGAVRAAQEGKSAGDIADAAADEGATGALVGGALHLGGEAASGVAGLLRQGKGLIPRYLRAKDAGTYQTPEMQALPSGAEGLHEAARQGHGRVAARMGEQERAAGTAYEAALNPPKPPMLTPQELPAQGPRNSALDRFEQLRTQRRIGLELEHGAGPGQRATPEGTPLLESPATGLDRPVDRQKLITALEAQRAKNIDPNTGIPFDPDIDLKFAQTIKRLGPSGTTNTVEGVIGQRRAIGEKGNFGNPNASTEDKAWQKIYMAHRQAIRDAAPDVGAADDAYAAYANRAARNRDIIYQTEDDVLPAQMKPSATEPSDELLAPKTPETPEVKRMRVLKEKLGVRNLERYGDTASKPGREMQPYLEELAASDPEFGDALNFIGAKSALEGTRIGAPHLPTNLTGATEHLGGISMNWIRQNARFLVARGFDPAMLAAGKLKLVAPFTGATNPLFEAYAATKEREKKKRPSWKRGD
jgi:hypothetical protein